MMTRTITFSRKGFKVRARTEYNGIILGSKVCWTRAGAIKDLRELLEIAEKVGKR